MSYVMSCQIICHNSSNALAGRILAFAEGMETNQHWAVQAFTVQQGKKLVEFMVDHARRREANSQLLAKVDESLEELLVSKNTGSVGRVEQILS